MDDNLKLLHIIGSLDQRSGGPLRAVLNLCVMGVPLGLHSEILGFEPFLASDHSFPEELIHSFSTTWPASYGYSPDLRKWCGDNLRRFDIVMLHGMWEQANWEVSRQCLEAGIPYIVFPHGMLDYWCIRGQGPLKRLKKTAYWHWRGKRLVTDARALFFTMPRELENSRTTFPQIPTHSMIVAPYGVLPCSDAPCEGPSAAVDQDGMTKIALFLGRIHPVKRLDLLIEAWAVAAMPPGWRLVISGPGQPAYVQQLRELARTRGVEGSVQFTGPVAGTDKRYLLQRASWFLLPSEHENFGVAVLEAVTSGCAVAVSDEVYLADEFPAGSEILPLEVEAWACFMRDRMTDDAWRTETARLVQERLDVVFSQERVSRGWVDCVRAALNGYSRRSFPDSGTR